MTSSVLGTESLRDFAESHAKSATLSVRATDRTVARAIWMVSVVVYIALATGTAMTRQPYGDEGELASPAYNLVHRGHLEVTQWEGPRQSHKAYWMPPVFFFAQAGWQMLVGFGVIESRLATVVWGLILIFAVGAIVRRVTGDMVLASLIGCALATDYTYLQHAGVGRCEIMSAALAILASAAYLFLRDRSLSAAVFTSHALMTLSGLTHPVGGMVWMPCLFGLQFWLDGRRLRWKDYALGALPYLLGALGWGAYILQDPAEFQRQFFRISLSEHRFAGFADPITALRRELNRFLAYYGVRSNASWAVRLKVMLPAGYVVGITGALLIPGLRRRRFIRICLILLAAQLLILTFIEGTKQSHYIVHVIPTIVAILVAVLWTAYTTQPSLRRVLVIAALMFVVIQVGPVLFRIRENPYGKDFLPTVETVRPFVEQKLLIASGPEFGTPFSFPENVVNRPDYGFRSLLIPDIVVTSLAQYERNTAVARADPLLYFYMTVTFHQRFRLLFQHGDFAVYKHVM
jgi:hypothetical protein